MSALRSIPAALLACASLAALPVPAQERVNQSALELSEFNKRVNEYIALHRKLDASLPRMKPTAAPADIRVHEHELAARIRAARASAAPGDIFTPATAVEIRKLIGIAKEGNNAARIDKSLKRSEPRAMKLRVNDSYPTGVPMQSTPATLLANLPRLPPEVDYRIVGKDLVLRDVKANLIIDLVPACIP